MSNGRHLRLRPVWQSPSFPHPQSQTLLRQQIASLMASSIQNVIRDVPGEDAVDVTDVLVLGKQLLQQLDRFWQVPRGQFGLEQLSHWRFESREIVGSGSRTSCVA